MYTLGIPLAFKLGHMKYADFFAGVEADRALQYQEKQKVGDSVQHRFGEWWSDNFFNQNYIDGGGGKPYTNMIARPGLLSFGYTFNTNKNNRFRRGDGGGRHRRRRP